MRFISERRAKKFATMLKRNFYPIETNNVYKYQLDL